MENSGKGAFISEQTFPLCKKKNEIGEIIMGFTYGRNPYTNRMTLACDFCNGIKTDTHKDGGLIMWVRKIPCPYGYCQAWATCNICYKKGRHKFSSTGLPGDPERKNHLLCRRRVLEEKNKQRQGVIQNLY